MRGVAANFIVRAIRDGSNEGFLRVHNLVLKSRFYIGLITLAFIFLTGEDRNNREFIEIIESPTVAHQCRETSFSLKAGASNTLAAILHSLIFNSYNLSTVTLKHIQ